MIEGNIAIDGIRSECTGITAIISRANIVQIIPRRSAQGALPLDDWLCVQYLEAK